MRTVHVVVPDGIDDPARPSGGNGYDRRLCEGLAELGWVVHETAVPGAWPHPGATARTILAAAIAAVPDGRVVLVDGLVASSVPEVLVPEADRVRLVVLVHMPLDTDEECRALSAAAAVVVTSGWTRRSLVERHGLSPHDVHVAEPGADAARLVPGTSTGHRLLCVAAVTPGKGHDVLVRALTTVADLDWDCVCVGSLDRDPEFVDALRRQIRESGIGERLELVGPRTGSALDQAYAATDALVLASRSETYGMVVTEALARGLPVVATDVGGVPEALGHGDRGVRPGLLVPPGDPGALAGALRRWLGDPDLRRCLREAARERRAQLPGWSVTSGRVAEVLDGLLVGVAR